VIATGLSKRQKKEKEMEGKETNGEASSLILVAQVRETSALIKSSNLFILSIVARDLFYSG
jgi:hypothetical protein